mgnify:CR=1 FL=1
MEKIPEQDRPGIKGETFQLMFNKEWFCNQQYFTTYLVTKELETSIITKVLRFFKLKKKREEFSLSITYLNFKPDDVIKCDSVKVKIIKIIK